MTPEKYQLLIDELNQRKKQCESLAQGSANDYVTTGKEDDRNRSKSHLNNADIWNQARNLVTKYYQ